MGAKHTKYEIRIREPRIFCATHSAKRSELAKLQPRADSNIEMSPAVENSSRNGVTVSPQWKILGVDSLLLIFFLFPCFQKPVPGCQCVGSQQRLRTGRRRGGTDLRYHDNWQYRSSRRCASVSYRRAIMMIMISARRCTCCLRML